MSLPRLFSILLGMFLCSIGLAQHYSLDSLRNVYFNFKDEKKYEEGLKFFSQQVNSLPPNEISARYLLVRSFEADMIGYIGHYDSAVKMVRPLKNIPIKDDDDYTKAWADCMHSVGQWYIYNGQADSSLYFFKLSLNARLNVKDPYLPRLADNYSYVGYIYLVHFKYYGTASQYYLKEGKILEKYGAGNFKWQNHYRNLAITFSKFDRQKAINMNMKALTYVDSSKSSLEMKAAILDNIANAYSRMAVDTKSGEERLSLCQKSLSYRRQSLGLAQLLDLPDESSAQTYSNMASVYDLLGHDSAMCCIDRALTLSRQAWGTSSMLYARYYCYKGTYTNNPLEAIPQMRKGIKLVIQSNPPSSHEINSSFSVCGDWFERHYMPDSALLYYSRAVIGKWPVSNVLDLPDLKGDIPKNFQVYLGDKAHLLYEIGRRDRSKKHLESSVQHYYLVEKVYNQILLETESEEERLNQIKSVKWQYDNALKAAFLLYENYQGDLDDVWHFMEKSKGAVNMYQTQELSSTLFSEKDKTLIMRKRHLMGETKHGQAMLETKGANHDSIRLQLFELNLQIDSVDRLLTKGNKLLTKVDDNASIVLKDISDQLLSGPKECFVQFHFTDSVLFVLSVSAAQRSIRRFNIEEVKLANEYGDNLKKCLQEGVKTKANNYGYQDFIKNARGLYALLLEDLGLEKYEGLIIISDGFLSGLPLEVLLTDDVVGATKPDFRALPYLMKFARITYGFSASWLLHAKQWEPKIGNKKPALLAVAYADVGHKALQQKQGLPGSLKEAQALQATWNENFALLQGDEASEKELKTKVSQYEILHLATHNEVNEENSLKSGIVLRTDKDPENDGILHSYEIYQLDSKVGMVVLSACESGLGKFQSGEGFLGVGRAFAQIGTPYIVSSLWKTSDVFSTHLMKEFYQNFKYGSAPAEALHKAKLKFIQGGDELSAHPSYWSSYVLMGNSTKSRTQDNPMSPLAITLLGGGVLLMLGAMLYFKKR